jgi:hypothetical protein
LINPRRAVRMTDHDIHRPSQAASRLSISPGARRTLRAYRAVGGDGVDRSDIMMLWNMSPVGSAKSE